MARSLNVASGLPWETAGEALFVEALSAQGVKLRFRRLSDQDLTSVYSTDVLPVVVLLLPILGDNDLTDEIRTQVVRLAAHDTCHRCAIVVIAQGDRHVTDEVITPDTPFSIKTSHLFSGVGPFEILEKKLDKFTAAELALEVLDLVDATSSRDVLEVSCIAGLLPRAPKWYARKRLLDFYDPDAGCSLLKTAERAVRKRIASHIQTLDPRVLKMNHAGFGDSAISDLEGALNAEVIDLGSNDFSWQGIAPQLRTCRWLGLAANGVKQVCLSQLPKKLEHLYLHKNTIYEFSARLTEVARLKSLSLYRNRLTTFNWPPGESTITRLNIGANPILSLPDTLGDCKALEFLGLARTNVSILPEWVFSLEKLRELDISYIEDRIPPAQIAQLRRQHVSLITRPGLVIK